MAKPEKKSALHIDIRKDGAPRTERDFMGVKAPPPPKPDFTDEELRCIHKEISTLSWQREQFYDERRSLLRKLDVYLAARGPQP